MSIQFARAWLTAAAASNQPALVMTAFSFFFSARALRPRALSVVLGAALLVACRFGGASATPPEPRQPGQGLRGRSLVDRLSVQDFEKSLQQYLEMAQDGDDNTMAKRLHQIEASMARTYQALPKNEFGRLSPPSVRYIVRSYFAKEQGWLIRGLEPQSLQQGEDEIHEVIVLQDKVPAVLGQLMESRRTNHGLSLGDVVAIVALLERLILDESLELLEAAYELHGLDPVKPIAEKALHDVLTSFLVLFREGHLLSEGDFESLVAHATEEPLLNYSDPVEDEVIAMAVFERDMVANYHFEQHGKLNPFDNRSYSFKTAWLLADRLAHQFGKWQNSECREMKDALGKLSTDTPGLVPLDRFYTHTSDARYQFLESANYLRRTGALDESVPDHPLVRIPNYIGGPSNCIASSQYYSVCCLNECEVLLSEIEGLVQAPVASSRRLLRLVSNLSSPTVDAPRNLSSDLVTKLQAVADHHGGSIPLHGRLFAQWLHLAFPSECAYPHKAADVEALQVAHWNQNQHVASPEEVSAYISAAQQRKARPETPAASVWTDEEVLPLLEQGSRQRSLLPWDLGSSLVRVVAQLAMFAVVLRAAFLGGSAAARACAGVQQGEKECKGKEGGTTLPMYL